MVIPETQPRAAANARSLIRELEWLEDVLRIRVNAVVEGASDPASIYEVEPPDLQAEPSMYADLVAHYEMAVAERIAVLLALAPHVRPALLDLFFSPNRVLRRGYAEFGGVEGKQHGGFLPTGETVLFVLSDGDLQKRFACERLFGRDHYFARHCILTLEAAPHGEPAYSGRLLISDEIIDLLTSGELRKPDFSRNFPAHLITTELTWDDLVLAPTTRRHIEELEAWLRHEEELMNDWGLRRRLRPGYKCLFYGPPGTGKTLAASLLGKQVGRDVYRIDLSTVVSKYIGETEKNLERIFERAENLKCILFFDEADALFGMRTNVQDAHDRYANQEVSYLLQRVEDFPGLVILASNFKTNIDEAFMRRFQAVVHFPMPSVAERQQLWRNSFSERASIAEDVRLADIAAKYELSGGAIMNVVRYASLMALEKDTNVIDREDVIGGIRRELQKEGKTL